uniref:F-box domain-containing protein n=1 Tax=Trichogramma kaykai TaxID=54128 RepID=A0ABD2VV71_9HYME
MLFFQIFFSRGFYFKFGHIHFKLVLLPYDIVQAIARHIGLLNKLRFDSRPLLSRASDSMRRAQCRLYANPRRQNFNSRDILDESGIIHSSWLYTCTVKTVQQKKAWKKIRELIRATV